MENEQKSAEQLALEERGKRLAKRVTFVEFWCLIGFILILLLLLTYRWISVRFPVVCHLWLLYAMAAPFVCTMILRVILPEKVPGYPDDSYILVDAFTKQRVVRGVIVIVSGMLIAYFLGILWPVTTIPKKIPTTITCSRDDNKLLAGDFGEIARWDYDGNCWYACTSVEAYGPFKYGGDIEKLTWRHMIIDDITWQEPSQSWENSSHSAYDITAVKFSQYDDGTWMILKHYEQCGERIPADSPDEIPVAMYGWVQKIPYKKRNYLTIANRWADAWELTEATDGALVWEEVDGKLIWSKE